MRRWGVPSPVKALAVVCTAVVVTVGGAAVPASSAHPAAGTTFTLVSPGPCAAPATVVGRACAVTTSNPTTVSDGRVQWTHPGWRSTYTWKIPATIPPTGANLTMALALTNTGRPGDQLCQKIAVATGFSLKAGQNPGLDVCAVAPGSDSGSRTLTLIPPSSPAGSILYLLIGQQDGGQFIYRYRAGAAKPPTCKAPPRTVASTGAEDCKYRVRWSFNQVRQPITGDLSVQRTAGSGSFRFTLKQGESLTGRHCAGPRIGGIFATGRVVHIHEQIADDIVIEMKLDDKEFVNSCVTIPSSRPVKSLNVDLRALRVSASNDRDCPVGTYPRLVLRGGKPTELVTMSGCGHRHAYFPSASGVKDPESVVNVKIDIRPA